MSPEYLSIKTFTEKLEQDQPIGEAEAAETLKSVRDVQRLSEVDKAPFEMALRSLRTAVEAYINRKQDLQDDVKEKLGELHKALPITLAEQAEAAVREYDLKKQMSASRGGPMDQLMRESQDKS